MANEEEEKIPSIQITFPAKGGERFLTPGTLHLDLFNGVATLPNKDREDLSDSLRALGVEVARSCVIKVDQVVQIAVNGRGAYEASQQKAFAPIFQEIKTIDVIITADTKLSMWASTHPRGIPQVTASTVLSGNIQVIESVTPLGAAGTFIGTARDVTASKQYAISVYADQAGTLYIESNAFTNDPADTRWRVVDTLAVAAGVSRNEVYPVTSKYYRPRYVNGGIAQTIFELTTMLKL